MASRTSARHAPAGNCEATRRIAGLIDPGRSEKGRRTAEAILAAALDLMGREGYGQVTIERVAAETGIRKGNLQYYFPTKDVLLRSVIAFQIDRQKAGYSAVIATASKEPTGRLSAMLRHDLALSRDAVVKAQAWEKWAFAAHDTEARAVVDHWYDWVTDRYAEPIGALRPDLSGTERKRLAVLVYGALEGVMPFMPEPKAGPLDRWYEKALLGLVESHGIRG